MSSDQFRLGIISDTHGLIRPAAIDALKNCDHILHAGDVGDAAVLSTLKKTAPVTAVRGNTDGGSFGRSLPVFDMVEIAGYTFYIRHIFHEIDIAPVAAGVDVVVFGHSHEPELWKNEGVLFINPGSIGPRRFDLPISLAILTLTPGDIRSDFIEIG